MRIDELKRIAEENDYEYSKVIWNHRFARKNSDNYITINGDYINRIWTSIQGYCDDKDFNMIKASIEFAETPPEDREREKKFYLKHKYFQSHIDCKQYFCIRISNGKPLLKGFPTPHADKIEFTLKEIEEIKERFDTDLADFELVEVVDE